MSDVLVLRIRLPNIKTDTIRMAEGDELWLDNTGVCDRACAAVRMAYLEGVLSIHATGDGDVGLERLGRRKILGGQAIRLVTGDIVCLGSQRIRITIDREAERKGDSERQCSSIFKRMFGAVARLVLPKVQGELEPREAGWEWQDEEAMKQYDDLPDDVDVSEMADRMSDGRVEPGQEHERSDG
ncbi:MAG: hypothetical protein IKY83_06815 [Proteobacteria bacterium]|nr:hypothetical protein [Pseudomonadota bacterium]